tara:strand:- start:229 stop:477 length:249 start_codon:yes stop_codon:yes gene_type:complete
MKTSVTDLSTGVTKLVEPLQTVAPWIPAITDRSISARMTRDIKNAMANARHAGHVERTRRAKIIAGHRAQHAKYLVRIGGAK